MAPLFLFRILPDVVSSMRKFGHDGVLPTTTVRAFRLEGRRAHRRGVAKRASVTGSGQ